MRELAWNKVIFNAISELKFIFELNHFIIDRIFLHCEKKMLELGAPDREIKLRLFALAIYCDKNYPKDFFETVVFARFSSALDFLHFKNVSKMLIEENNFALVVFWSVLRCSFAGSLRCKDYFPLEREIKNRLVCNLD